MVRHHGESVVLAVPFGRGDLPDGQRAHVEGGRVPRGPHPGQGLAGNGHGYAQIRDQRGGPRTAAEDDLVRAVTAAIGLDFHAFGRFFPSGHGFAAMDLGAAPQCLDDVACDGQFRPQESADRIVQAVVVGGQLELRIPVGHFVGGQHLVPDFALQMVPRAGIGHAQVAGRHQDLLAGLALEEPPELERPADEGFVGRVHVHRRLRVAGIAVGTALGMGQVVALEAEDLRAPAGQVAARGRAHGADADDNDVVVVTIAPPHLHVVTHRAASSLCDYPSRPSSRLSDGHSRRSSRSSHASRPSSRLSMCWTRSGKNRRKCPSISP